MASRSKRSSSSGQSGSGGATDAVPSFRKSRRTTVPGAENQSSSNAVARQTSAQTAGRTSRAGQNSLLKRHPVMLTAAFWLLLGWIVIAIMFKFQISPGVFMMSLGWFSLVVAGGLVFVAAQSVGRDREPLKVVLVSEREELLSEKRALLKAIREAEFDRELGKISQKEAETMLTTYRSRAVLVLERLAILDGTVDESLSAEQRLAVELDARVKLMMESERRLLQKKSTEGSKV